MIAGKPWFAFFSHTGSEIAGIVRDNNIKPDCIVTNKSPGDPQINPDVLKIQTQFKYTGKHPSVSDYDTLLSECGLDCFCTLHGWMKIIPEAICNDYEIYNLHPGLITRYPELKGKDPQARAHDSDKYSDVGVVIHQVIPAVDEGDILIELSEPHPGGDPTCCLKDLARLAWNQFFQQRITREQP